MLKNIWTMGVAVAVLSSALVSGATAAGSCCGDKTKKLDTEAPKTEAKAAVEVKVCPMMQAPVKNTSGGSQVVGEYKVYFCCGGCKPAFNKLSKEEQAKRIADALKVQRAAKKA